MTVNDLVYDVTQSLFPPFLTGDIHYDINVYCIPGTEWGIGLLCVYGMGSIQLNAFTLNHHPKIKHFLRAHDDYHFSTVKLPLQMPPPPKVLARI